MAFQGRRVPKRRPWKAIVRQTTKALRKTLAHTVPATVKILQLEKTSLIPWIRHASARDETIPQSHGRQSSTPTAACVAFSSCTAVTVMTAQRVVPTKLKHGWIL